MSADAVANIAQARKELLDELPNLVREYIDTARAEGTTQAYDRLMGFALKGVEGLQVDNKGDKYANLPTIHIEFAPGLQLVTTVDAAAPLPPPAEVPEVEDVTPKSPFQTTAAEAWDPFEDLPTILPPLTPEARQAAEQLIAET